MFKSNQLNQGSHLGHRRWELSVIITLLKCTNLQKTLIYGGKSIGKKDKGY